MNTPIVDLKTKGFVRLNYPQSLRRAVVRAVDSWRRFYLLPEELKKGLPYSNNADGVGYELKNGIGNKADRKENFDVALGGAEWLYQHSEGIYSAPILEFIENATALVALVKPLILDFARQVEITYGLKGFADEVNQSDNAYFIRFNHFFGERKVGEEMATAHNDQSGFTLHLFESAPGLQCFTYDKQWVDMPVSEGETVIIPSMQMQLQSKGELVALGHRVVATSETADDGRSSVVCFVQLKNTAKYDKDRWGRLQEMEPGWNYGLSQAKFQKFFKK
ncbi:MAG: 2OG-Fe(II) oxygenase family protein [bacterium]